ncbi:MULTISPECIES: hypothetical protein [Trichocoleus]|uniref:Uncharacterized protein n=1 Tax=Trichocoleus desertorum GB2-A4 TaxID=2933944 RepID=A0ABV0J7P0_9CYAN|nr:MULTISPECIES: hypothetical protein [unclassified Trichocoleus]MBD1863893.1 hypothetical protein [Trichocoleus sp. FACHB-46]
MQLQIECNNTSLTDQACLLCNQEFELQEARVIVCNEGGKNCGDLCPGCISKGPEWIWHRLLQTSNISLKVEMIPISL